MSRRVHAPRGRTQMLPRDRRVLDRLPVGVFRSTTDGRMLYANPALVKMGRYPDVATLVA